MYLARSLYALLADTVYDDIALCDTNTLRMMRKPVKEKKQYAKNEVNTVTYSLYPNPAHNSITVATNNVFCTDCYITLYDLAGRQVLKVRLPDGKQKMDIDITAIQYGMYIANICDSNGSLHNTRLSVIR